MINQSTAATVLLSSIFITPEHSAFFLNKKTLPPFFDASAFLNYCNTLTQNALQNLSIKDTECISLSIPNKQSHIRRIVQIPNPLIYLQLCYQMTQLFTQERFLPKSFKELKPTLHLQFKNNHFNKHEKDMIGKRNVISCIGYSHMLQLDISQFYPSIYTHSIPWAVLGKEKAKQEFNNKEFNRKNKKVASLPVSAQYQLSDKIDITLRCFNHNQTKGIPIGAEVFSVVASLITSRINEEFTAFLKNNKIDAKFHHYVDDYYIFCSTEEDAKAILSNFGRILQKYELQLNSQKTKIQTTEEINLSLFWLKITNEALDVIETQFQKGKECSYDKILHALEQVRNLRKKNYKGEHILSYFVSRLNPKFKNELKNIPWDVIDLVFSFILQSAYLEHSTLKYLYTSGLLTSLKQNTLPSIRKSVIIKTQLKEILFKLTTTCSNHFYTSELLWGLFIIYYMNYSKAFVKKDIFKPLAEYSCPFVQCLVMEIELDAEEDSFTQKNLTLYQNNTNEQFYTDQWIIGSYLYSKGLLTFQKSGNHVLDTVKEISFFNFDSKTAPANRNNHDTDGNNYEHDPASN
jgi:hypothetical protein